MFKGQIRYYIECDWFVRINASLKRGIGFAPFCFRVGLCWRVFLCFGRKKMSNAVEFNSLTANDEVKVKVEPPSRASEKPSDEEVAKYSKTRVILVVLFGILIIAMVVAAVVIIIVSPKCPPPKVPIDREWFKDQIVYQIDVKSLNDTAESLEYLNGLGVKILRLNSIYPSTSKNNDIEDHTAIDKSFGTMSDFEELVKKAHDKNMKIVLDFIPNHTSKKHKWFVDSAKKTDSEKRGWYVWRKESNNWPSVTGGSAWKKEPPTNEFYLHQFEEGKPDLNLRNDLVVEELNKILKFWMDKGVDGFRAVDVQYLLENSTFSDEKQKSNYNRSSLTYDMTEHGQTFDLPENVELVKKFRDTLNKASSHKLLILDLKGNSNQAKQFAEQSDIPTYSGLLDLKKGSDIPSIVNRSVSEYLKSLSDKQIPNFVVSTSKNPVADRLTDLVDAMNVLLLTLPGIPSTAFGQELGLASNQNYMNEMKKQKDDEKSHYSLYKAAAKLRNENGFNNTDFRVVHVDSNILAYVRQSKYLVVINFNKKDDKDNINGLSGRGEVVLDSEFKLNKKIKDVNQLHLNAGQAIVVKLDKGFKYMDV